MVPTPHPSTPKVLFAVPVEGRSTCYSYKTHLHNPFLLSEPPCLLLPHHISCFFTSHPASPFLAGGGSGQILAPFGYLYQFRLMFCSKSQVGTQLHGYLAVFQTPIAFKGSGGSGMGSGRRLVPFWGRARRVDRMSPAVTQFGQFNPTLSAYLQLEMSGPTWACSAFTKKAKEQSKTAGSD